MRKTLPFMLIALLVFGFACQPQGPADKAASADAPPVGGPPPDQPPPFVDADAPPPPGGSKEFPQPGFQRPVPGSMGMFADVTEQKIAEAIAKTKEIKAAGKKLSDFFPKMMAVANEVEIKPDDVIADLGAGTGLFGIALLEHGIEFEALYAVDIDEPSIRLGKQMLEILDLPGKEKIHWVRSRGDDVTMPKDSVDLWIVINSPFYRATEKEPGKLVVRDVAQLCINTAFEATKTGGRAHVVEAAKTETNEYPAKLYTAAFENAGFTVAEIKTAEFFNMPHHHISFRKK